METSEEQLVWMEISLSQVVIRSERRDSGVHFFLFSDV